MTNLNLPANLTRYINTTFRTQSLKQLNDLTPSKVEIFDFQPIPQNYTVVFRLDKSTTQTIKQLQTKIQSYSSNQFFYPPEQLHITLIGNLNIETNHQRIIDALHKHLSSYPELRFVLCGLGSNQYCSSISAFPTFNISQFRNQLREEIHSKGDDYSVHLYEFEKVGWINYLRYLQSPTQEFFDYLLQHHDYYFGICRPVSLELYSNTSKVLDPTQSKLLWKTKI